VGATITFFVMLIFLFTKFTHGAWIIVILIPTLVWVFTRIHRHYAGVATILSTSGQRVDPQKRHVQAIVLVGDVHRETLKLVEFANSLNVPWKAVHIAVNEERVADVQRKWDERVGIGELVIVRSPFRSLTRPLRQYVEKLLRQDPGGYVQVIMGELRTGNTATQALHQNAHIIQRLALNDLPGVAATVVPFQLAPHLDANGNGQEAHGPGVDEYPHVLPVGDAAQAPAVTESEIAEAVEQPVEIVEGEIELDELVEGRLHEGDVLNADDDSEKEKE
jgi:hypothetical protein